MSVDRSLRAKSSLMRHRNVLTRAERIAILQDQGHWDEKRSVLGLPKVAHRKIKPTKKEAKVAAAADGETETPAAETPK